MPTNREKIEEWSKAYWLLRFYQDFMFKLYFKTEIVGMEKLPPNTTFIFAPNHQNALIDALAILTLKHCWQPVFLARADIFKKPLLSKILTFLKIMPVYRIRDGFENLLLNDRIFLKTMDVIRNRNGLVILPEGNHAGFKYLRPLKKGIARIAFQAEDAANGELNIHIVPVGLEYSNYVRYRSKLLVRIGEPFPVKKYLDLYRQNKAQAYNAVIDELAERMKAEMINIDDTEHYDEYMLLLQLYPRKKILDSGLPKTQNQQFIISKELIGWIEKLNTNANPLYDELMSNTRKLKEKLAVNGIRPHALPLRKFNAYCLFWFIPLLIIFSPVALYGFINHFIPIMVPYLLSKKFQDVQFHSSVRHAVGLLLLPLVYLIQTLIVGITASSFVTSLLYLIFLPVSAVILFYWRRYCYKVVGTARLSMFKHRNPADVREIDELHERVMKFMVNR